MARSAAALQYLSVSQIAVTSVGAALLDRRWLRSHTRPADCYSRRARLLGHELNFHNRLDALKTVFPGHNQTKRRPVLLWQRMSVNTRGKHRQFIIGFGDRQAFGIGPRTVGRTLIRGFGGF